MRQLALFALLGWGLLAVPVASAQTVDPPGCAPYRAKWDSVANSADLGALDSVIKAIPTLCPALAADAKKRRVQAAAKVTRPLPPPRPPEDPCVRARNDWPYMQNAAEQTLRTYIADLPAACGVWRQQAEVKLKAFEDQRIAAANQAALAKEQAERAAQLSQAIRATGIAGDYVYEDDRNIYKSKDKCLTPSQRVRVWVDGVVIVEELGFTTRDRIKRNTVSAVNGSVFTIASSSGSWEIRLYRDRLQHYFGPPNYGTYSTTMVRCP